MPIDISAHKVCSDPNIWVFDDVLSPQLLDYIDSQFASENAAGPRPGESKTMPSILERGVDIYKCPESKELFDTLRSITNINEVESCCKLLIYDVLGKTQEAHVDHISLDAMPEWQGYHMCQLDLAKQSISKWCSDQVVPTFTFVVYFNDVGAIHFPKAALDDQTIKCKRGRIVMFQNYIDEQRPNHNDMCTHYGIYDENVPKRILTGGMVANSTPSTCGGTGNPGQGWIYSVAKHRTSHHDDAALPNVSKPHHELHELGQASTEARNNQANVLRCVQKDPENFRYASDRLRDDKKIVSIAVERDPDNLQYASDGMKDTFAIVKTALKKNGGCLRYAGPRCRDNRHIVECAMKTDPEAFAFASANLKNDKDMVLAALRATGKNLFHAAEDMKNDEDVVLVSCERDSESGLSFAPKELQERLHNAANVRGVSLSEYAREHFNAKIIQVAATRADVGKPTKPTYASVVEADGETWNICCTNLAGAELATFSFKAPPSKQNAGLAFRSALANTLGVSRAAMQIVLPGGQVLATVDPTLTFDELMAPTPFDFEKVKKFRSLQAIIDSETVFQHQCTKAFKQFDKNNDDAIDAMEADSLVKHLCTSFDLPSPDGEQVGKAFDAADVSRDGKLQVKEFPKFFKIILQGLMKELRK